jgi:beta-lactam-binding protein with PASTA domain
MKKQHILIISIIIILVIVGGVFFFKSKSNNSFNPQMQNMEEVTIDSLSIGNWVSAAAKKDNGSYVASMIMVCDSKDSCQNNRSNQDNNQQPPSGNPPTNEMPAGINTGVDMETRTMFSGTITEINADSLILSLDTGETATLFIVDSTRITKR